MRNLKPIWLLAMLLAISALAAKASAQEPSPEAKSQSPSNVKTSALALIADLEVPSTCSDPTCLADVLSAKLKAAVAGLKSIVRADEAREGIVSDLEQRIKIRGDIIADLQKVDRNNQQIGTLNQDTRAILDKQHEDDQRTIGQIQDKLDSCRNNQKWIAGISGVTGAYLGYKYGKQVVSATGLLNLSSAGSQYLMFQPTADERAKGLVMKQFTR